MAPRIELEPARFALTGGGLALLGLRPEFEAEKYAGTLDAPLYVPTGSTRISSDGIGALTTQHREFRQ